MKYIITSYITHGILLFLSLYAIGCCGFHLLPVWGISENYESINNTFLSIALSYVAGLVIFVLTSVLPRQQREEEVFKLWEPHLEKLYNEMSERIEEVMAFVGINKDKMNALTVEDCKPLERYGELLSGTRLRLDNLELKNMVKVGAEHRPFACYKGLYIQIIVPNRYDACSSSDLREGNSSNVDLSEYST